MPECVSRITTEVTHDARKVQFGNIGVQIEVQFFSRYSYEVSDERRIIDDSPNAVQSQEHDKDKNKEIGGIQKERTP